MERTGIKWKGLRTERPSPHRSLSRGSIQGQVVERRSFTLRIFSFFHLCFLFSWDHDKRSVTHCGRRIRKGSTTLRPPGKVGFRTESRLPPRHKRVRTFPKVRHYTTEGLICYVSCPPPVFRTSAVEVNRLTTNDRSHPFVYGSRKYW